ncbi:hypothetical protein P692DRAFT_20869046 [Suillus brevipes Sb2]|nr:hypothetical protein P692DRAFT_20869046 [Suillus brevipes Sb2]
MASLHDSPGLCSASCILPVLKYTLPPSNDASLRHTNHCPAASSRPQHTLNTQPHPSGITSNPTVPSLIEAVSTPNRDLPALPSSPFFNAAS